MKPDVTLNDSYQVVAGAVTKLTVTIGEGQYGTSSVFLGGDPLVTGQPTITDLVIGDGAVVKGKRLVIVSFVHDVQANTNKMTVTYAFTGGAKDKSFVAKGTVDTEGDMLYFRAAFALV